MKKDYKSGFVTLIGRPNVGKSTLMNYLIGQKIAITSNKPQTTRNRIQTVLTTEEGQIIFVDTPGIHKAKNKLGEYMVNVAERTLNEVDAVLWLVEPTTFIGAGEKHIADQLKKLDPSNKTEYEDNATAYKEELTGLDKEYQDTVEHAKRKTLLFADRFPFRYQADDYGLKYYAAFKGCSAETEARFKTITFLANKVDEENLPYVMTIEGSDHKIAKSVISNTKKKTQQILTMDSMQSTTAQDVKDGKSYLSVMEENLSVLQKALN